MIRYEIAKEDDWKAIALIHAQSWKDNYRGIYSEHYLNHEVVNERLENWKQIFEGHPKNGHRGGSYIITALDNERMVGFSCTYSFFKGSDEHYLDNLHVLNSHQSKGIGAQLLLKSAKWAFDIENFTNFYLLVYEQNVRAIKFYKSMGASISEPFTYTNDDGSKSQIIKCSWDKLPLA